MDDHILIPCMSEMVCIVSLHLVDSLAENSWLKIIFSQTSKLLFHCLLASGLLMKSHIFPCMIPVLCIWKLFCLRYVEILQ